MFQKILAEKNRIFKKDYRALLEALADENRADKNRFNEIKKDIPKIFKYRDRDNDQETKRKLYSVMDFLNLSTEYFLYMKQHSAIAEIEKVRKVRLKKLNIDFQKNVFHIIRGMEAQWKGFIDKFRITEDSWIGCNEHLDHVYAMEGTYEDDDDRDDYELRVQLDQYFYEVEENAGEVVDKGDKGYLESVDVLFKMIELVKNALMPYLPAAERIAVMIDECKLICDHSFSKINKSLFTPEELQRLETIKNGDNPCPEWFDKEVGIALAASSKKYLPGKDTKLSDYVTALTYFMKNPLSPDFYLKKKDLTGGRFAEQRKLLLNDRDITDQSEQLATIAEQLHDPIVLRKLLELHLINIVLSKQSGNSALVVMDLLARLIKEKYAVYAERAQGISSKSGAHELFFDILNEICGKNLYKLWQEHDANIRKGLIPVLKNNVPSYSEAGQTEAHTLLLVSEKNLKTFKKGVYGEDCTEDELSAYQVWDENSVQLNMYIDEYDSQKNPQGYVQILKCRKPDGREGLLIDVINPGNDFSISPSLYLRTLLEKIRQICQERNYDYIYISAQINLISNRDSVQNMMKKIIADNFSKEKVLLGMDSDHQGFIYQSIDTSCEPQEYFVLYEKGKKSKKGKK